MAFDFKKEYKEFYMPKNKPEIVNVPKANYIAVRGKGNPNEEGGAYQQAISVLYAVAYTLKMSYKTDYKIEGFFEYVVPPLEGFWWQDDVESVDYKFVFEMKYKDLLLKLADIVEQNLVCGNSMDKYVLQDKYEIRNEWQQEFVRNLPNEVMKNCIQEIFDLYA